MTYTDYLGNPITVGDTIAYPTCSGSSSAWINLGYVAEILDLIPHNPSDLEDCTAYLQDDLKKAHPPRRLIATRFIPDDPQPPTASKWYRKGINERDDSKAYVLRIRKLRDDLGSAWNQQDRLVMLKNVDRVIVVTGMVNN